MKGYSLVSSEAISIYVGVFQKSMQIVTFLQILQKLYEQLIRHVIFCRNSNVSGNQHG
jgi:hypothetical protein